MLSLKRCPPQANLLHLLLSWTWPICSRPYRKTQSEDTWVILNKQPKLIQKLGEKMSMDARKGDHWNLTLKPNMFKWNLLHPLCISMPFKTTPFFLLIMQGPCKEMRIFWLCLYWSVPMSDPLTSLDTFFWGYNYFSIISRCADTQDEIIMQTSNILINWIDNAGSYNVSNALEKFLIWISFCPGL